MRKSNKVYPEEEDDGFFTGGSQIANMEEDSSMFFVEDGDNSQPSTSTAESGWDLLADISQKYAETGFLDERLVNKEEIVDEEEGFFDDSENSVERIKREMDLKMESDLQKQKNLLLGDFNLIIHSQAEKYEAAHRKHMVDTQKVMDEKMSGYIKTEVELKDRVKELHEGCEDCKQSLEKIKKAVEEVNSKYIDVSEKLKLEKINTKEMTLDLGGDLDADFEEDLVFGSEWFEDTIDYDLSTIEEGVTKEKGTKFIPIIKKDVNLSTSKFSRIIEKFNFLKSDVRFIESRFGILVGTYFRLFRTQVLINCVVGFLIFLCYIPFLIFRFIDTYRPIHSHSEDWGPNLSTTYFIPSFLSFGSFYKVTKYPVLYKVLYFCMVLPGFLIFTLTLFIEIIIENRFKTEHEIKTRDIQQKELLAVMMSIYDYKVWRKSVIEDQKWVMWSEIDNILKKKELEEKIRNRSKLDSFKLKLRKVFGWTIIIIMIVSSWAILIVLNIFKDTASERLTSYISLGSIKIGAYIIPAAVSILNMITPKVALWITNFEKWDKESNKVKVIIIRLYCLKVASIGLLCGNYIYFMTQPAENQAFCGMKVVGDEIFNLVVTTCIGEFAGGLSPVLSNFLKKMIAYVKMKRERKKKRKEKERKKREEEELRKKKEKEQLEKDQMFAFEIEQTEGTDDDTHKNLDEEGKKKTDGDDELTDEDELSGQYYDDDEDDEEDEGEDSDSDEEFEDYDEDEVEESEDEKEAEGGNEDEKKKKDGMDAIEENDHTEEKPIGEGEIELEDKKNDGGAKKNAKKKKKKKKKKKRKKRSKKKNVEKEPEKAVFESYKKLISVIYLQVLIWILLPFFPLGISLASILSLLIFKYQRYLLSWFMKSKKTAISAGDLGFFFLIFYILTYTLPLGMYYYSMVVYPMNTQCGFSSSLESNTTIMTMFRDVGYSSNIGIVFRIIYDHVFSNTLMLYIFFCVVLVLYIGRSDKISSLKTYINVVRTRSKRDTKMYDNKLLTTKKELENLKKKVDALKTKK